MELEQQSSSILLTVLIFVLSVLGIGGIVYLVWNTVRIFDEGPSALFGTDPPSPSPSPSPAHAPVPSVDSIDDGLAHERDRDRSRQPRQSRSSSAVTSSDDNASHVTPPAIIGQDYMDTVHLGFGIDSDSEERSTLQLVSKLMSAIRKAACDSYSDALDNMRTEAVKELRREGPIKCEDALDKLNESVNMQMDALAREAPAMNLDDIRDELHTFNNDLIHIVCDDSNNNIDPALANDVFQELSSALCKIPSGAEAPFSVLGVSVHPTSMRSKVLVDKAQLVMDAVQAAACEAYAHKMQLAINMAAASQETGKNSTGETGNCDEILDEIYSYEEDIQNAFPGADVTHVVEAWRELGTDIVNKICADSVVSHEKGASLLNEVINKMCP